MDIKRFIDQIKNDEFLETKFNAGIVSKLDADTFIIGNETVGAAETFSIGQPVYDADGNLMGYIGIGLYSNLDYSYHDSRIDRIPCMYWSICLPTKFCQHGKRVFTYWQNEERLKSKKGKTTYTELLKKQQDETNAFPMVFLFGTKSDEEIKKEIASIGAKSTKDLVSFGGGGYIHKDRKAAFLEMCKKHRAETAEFFKDDDNLYQAIKYQMYQHEYAYAEEDEQDNILSALCFENDVLVKDERIRRIWNKAADKVLGRE